MPYEMSLLFGFRDDEGGRDLQAWMNEAIGAMRADGTLEALERDYLKSAPGETLTPVQFDAFPESDETIRVVVTGDLPPLDYIGADGVPVVGWNTPTYASRTYKVLGKVDLADSVWLEVNDNADLYRFFKVEVDMK